MKNIMILICLGLVFLTACQSKEVKETPKKAACKVTDKKTAQTTEANTSFAYPQLLPTKSGVYSLLVVDKSEAKSPIEENKKDLQGVNDILSLTFEQATKIYPNLQIKNDPTYILFDIKGIAHQSTTLDDLTEYLKNNKAK